MLPPIASLPLSVLPCGVTAAITRDPEEPGNDSLSAVVRDAVIGALLAPAGYARPNEACADLETKEQ